MVREDTHDESVEDGSGGNDEEDGVLQVEGEAVCSSDVDVDFIGEVDFEIEVPVGEVDFAVDVPGVNKGVKVEVERLNVWCSGGCCQRRKQRFSEN